MSTVPQRNPTLEVTVADDDMEISSDFGFVDEEIEIDLDLPGDMGQDHDDDYVIEAVESPFHQPNQQAEDDKDDEEMKDDNYDLNLDDGSMRDGDDGTVRDEHLTDVSDVGQQDANELVSSILHTEEPSATYVDVSDHLRIPSTENGHLASTAESSYALPAYDGGSQPQTPEEDQQGREDAYATEHADGTTARTDADIQAEGTAEVNQGEHVAPTGDEYDSTPGSHVVHPVILIYEDREFSLFPSDSQDTQAFFLYDVSLAHQSIADLLLGCRQVLGESLGDEKDLALEIAEFDLYIGEDSIHASNASLAQILNAYVQLHHNDGNPELSPLYVTLYTNTRFSTRLDRLIQAATEGQGMSQLEFLPMESGKNSGYEHSQPDYIHSNDHAENGEYPEDATYVQEDDNSVQQWPEGAEHAVAVSNEEPEWTEERAEHGEGISAETVVDDAAYASGPQDAEAEGQEGYNFPSAAEAKAGQHDLPKPVEPSELAKSGNENADEDNLIDYREGEDAEGNLKDTVVSVTRNTSRSSSTLQGDSNSRHSSLAENQAVNSRRTSQAEISVNSRRPSQVEVTATSRRSSQAENVSANARRSSSVETHFSSSRSTSLAEGSRAQTTALNGPEVQNITRFEPEEELSEVALVGDDQTQTLDQRDAGDGNAENYYGNYAPEQGEDETYGNDETYGYTGDDGYVNEETGNTSQAYDDVQGHDYQQENDEVINNNFENDGYDNSEQHGAHYKGNAQNGEQFESYPADNLSSGNDQAGERSDQQYARGHVPEDDIQEEQQVEYTEDQGLDFLDFDGEEYEGPEDEAGFQYPDFISDAGLESVPPAEAASEVESALVVGASHQPNISASYIAVQAVTTPDDDDLNAINYDEADIEEAGQQPARTAFSPAQNNRSTLYTKRARVDDDETTANFGTGAKRVKSD